MTAENYAQASYEALKGGMDVEAVLVRLKEILEKNGHGGLLKESIRELLVQLEKDEADNTAHLVVAKAGDAKRYEKDVAEFMRVRGIEQYTTSVDEALVGGFVIRGKGHELNASYKKSLLTIYRSLTA